jgi:hypothetical protein
MIRVVDGIEIRPARVEGDAALIRSLETSFETRAILDVQQIVEGSASLRRQSKLR